MKRPRLKPLLYLLLLPILLLFGDWTVPIEQNLVIDGVATAVFEEPISLIAGQRITLESRNHSPGGDPVINLLSPEGTNVAADDNSGGNLEAKVRYRTPKTGTYLLIVRSRSTGTGGTADIYKNGLQFKQQVKFGGWIAELKSLSSREEIETIKLPNGATGTHRIYLLNSDGISIDKRILGGGTDNGARLLVSQNADLKQVVIGTDPGKAGKVRLVRNDALIEGRDPDGDGLGSSLELILGTCPDRIGFLNGVDCTTLADARDTDGDGISDGWEVLGRRDLSPHQPLAKWGADPRHKDMFVEVDFMKKSPDEPIIKMTENTAREFAKYYQDEVGVLSDEIKALHGKMLRNPDGKPGINVHLDIGKSPLTVDDITIYGDWGGFNAVEPVLVNGEWKGDDYLTAWKTHMHPARKGIFRYVLAPAFGGGSNPENSFAFSAGINSAWTLAHESGHAQGIGHSGPPCVTGCVDVNCKPNYPSIMNYAFDDGSVGFSDGLETLPLNNMRIKEWNAVPTQNINFLNILEKKFKFWVDYENGHVDWNRNGEFESRDRYVKSYINFNGEWRGCEYTRYNQIQVPVSTTTKSPSLVKFRNKLYLFYLDPADSKIKYRVSESSWDCNIPNAPCGTCSSARQFMPCGSFNENGVVPLLDSVVGFDAVSLNSEIIIVGIDMNRRLHDVRLKTSPAGNPYWNRGKAMPGVPYGDGEPSLASIAGTGTYLAYRYNNKVYYRKLLIDGKWTAPFAMSIAATQHVQIAESASPSLSFAYLPFKQSSLELYAAIAAPDGRLDIWCFLKSSGLWEKTSVLESRPGPIEGRPTMASTPYQYCCNSVGGWYSSDGPSNKFYLSFIDKSSKTPKIMTNYVKVNKSASGTITKTPTVGLLAPFDNTWSNMQAIDFLSDYQSTGSLFAATVHTDNSIWVRPRADGIFDFEYVNYNDWESLRLGICRNVVNPDGTVSNPIRCH